MEVEPIRTQLFQKRITPNDTKFFENPSTQPELNPMNCAAVSGQLLGIVSKKTAEEMTDKAIGKTLDEWILAMNKLGSTKYSAKDVDFNTIYNQLFLGYATIGFFTRTDGTGHAAVIVRYTDGNTYILDPQVRDVYVNEDIVNFKRRGNYTDRIFVLYSNTPLTKEEYDTIFAEDILSALVHQCNIYVGGRNIISSSRRLPSLPKRKVRSSSSSSKKRYTRRRRALRSGKGGYRSRVTGRTV